MKVLIIDNEEQVRSGLVSLLNSHCPEVEEIQEANGVGSGLAAIEKYSPDIVFLDVEMGDGTGMDLIRKLGKFNFQLIFITAHNKYAIDAFKFSAIDFLLKPIDADELSQAVSKAKKYIETKNLSEQLQIMQESLGTLKGADKRIVLKDAEAIHFIKVTDIIRCEADGPYTKFVISNAKAILISKGLKEYEDLLGPFGFLRTHHSHLINLKKIIRFDKGEGGSLIMENNDHVPVSQRKKEQLLEIISKM
ncbi:MAG: response regulator transcription factor [Bacteroidia bacterium]|nr:response regulator transcription factor [Bacteroidia bacterium]